MPGVPGKGGPVPKRSNARAGHRTKAEQPDKVKTRGRVEMPPAGRWRVEAKRWYKSLASSGQAEYFEPSDWEFARLLARLLSDQLGKEKPSSEMMKAILAAMNDLGTTEGARRRMRIEVERGVDDDTAAEVAVLDAYRRIGTG